MINSISGSMGYSQMAVSRGQGRDPFQKIDANQDSVLDQTELSTMTEKNSEKTGHTIDTETLMSEMDADADGQITQEEFEANRPQGPPPPQGPPQGMSGQKGGGMQVGGGQSLLEALSSSEETESTSLLDSLDTNGDGVVDSEEARAGASLLIQEYQKQVSDLVQADINEYSGYDFYT